MFLQGLYLQQYIECVPANNIIWASHGHWCKFHDMSKDYSIAKLEKSLPSP